MEYDMMLRLGTLLLALHLSVLTSHANAQASLHAEGAANLVFGVPIDRANATPAVLVRLGLVQERENTRVSGRLAAEGAWHPSGIWSSVATTKFTLGGSYDVRLHGRGGPKRPYFSLGLGVYRDIGAMGDVYRVWWIMPRAGIGGPIGDGEDGIGWELGAQYAGTTNLGSAPTNSRWLVFPVGVTWRFR